MTITTTTPVSPVADALTSAQARLVRTIVSTDTSSESVRKRVNAVAALNAYGDRKAGLGAGRIATEIAYARIVAFLEHKGLDVTTDNVATYKGQSWTTEGMSPANVGFYARAWKIANAAGLVPDGEPLKDADVAHVAYRIASRGASIADGIIASMRKLLDDGATVQEASETFAINGAEALGDGEPEEDAKPSKPGKPGKSDADKLADALTAAADTGRAWSIEEATRLLPLANALASVLLAVTVNEGRAYPGDATVRPVRGGTGSTGKRAKVTATAR